MYGRKEKIMRKRLVLLEEIEFRNCSIVYKSNSSIFELWLNCKSSLDVINNITLFDGVIEVYADLFDNNKYYDIYGYQSEWIKLNIGFDWRKYGKDIEFEKYCAKEFQTITKKAWSWKKFRFTPITYKVPRTGISTIRKKDLKDFRMSLDYGCDVRIIKNSRNQM